MFVAKKPYESSFAQSRAFGAQLVATIFTLAKYRETHQNTSFGSKKCGLATVVAKKPDESLFAQFHTVSCIRCTVCPYSFHISDIESKHKFWV